MASIKCGNCTKTHSSVQEVRNCFADTQDSVRNGATVTKASSWSLRSPGESPAHAAAVHASRVGFEVDGNGEALDYSNRPQAVQSAPVHRTKERAAEGMYRKAGTIYKVQKAVHGSGNNYAKRLVETLVIDKKTGKPKWKFEYAPGFVYELRPEHALTVEQAKEFGALYGACCVCGRTLTKEESIAAGIGPICAEKF